MEKKITKVSVLTILFLLLTFSTFFLGGMYFEGEQFVYLTLLGILGIAVFILIPAKQGIRRGLDWFVIGMPVVYAISLFGAIYFRNAMVEVIKYTGCLIVYFITKRLLADKKNWFMITVYIGGVLMSFIGLGAASGAYFISGAYENEKNLVMSLFQYHNTSALMLACVFLFGMSLYAKTNRLWLKLCICAGNMIALLTVVFSQSRGTWLLFPVMLVIYFWILPKGTRTASIPVLGTVVSALAVLKGLGNAFAQQNTPVCIGYMLASMIAAVLLGFFLEKLSGKVSFTKKTRIVFGAVILLFIVVFALFGRYLLPETIITRITEFNLESRTVTERFTFYKDAFSIFKNYPWIGIGGGGWPFIYGEYQSYHYTSNSPHSFLLHLMVETGIFGIAVFFLLVIVMIRLLIKLIKSAHAVRMEQAPLFTAAAVIFVHSMFDIDFSFYTVTTITWILLGLISEIEQPVQPKIHWLRWGGVVVSILVAISGILGKVAWDHYYKTADFMQLDANKAYQYASVAAALDPGNSMYCLTKGNIAFHLAASYSQSDQSKMREYADQAREAFERGYRSNPRDHMLIRELAVFYVNVGEFDKGCQLIEQLIQLQPLYWDSYLRVAEVYTSVAQIYQQNNDREGIKKAMGRLTTLWDEADAIGEEKGFHFELNKATKDAVLQAIRIMEQIEELEEKQ